MAMSWIDNSHRLNAHELEYLNKIDWLWSLLSPMQRSRVRFSISNDTLRQENSRHCIIGQAVVANRKNAISSSSLFLDIVIGLGNAIFYNGPSYDGLLGRKITGEEKKMLDDINYAKKGNKEHQYKRANELVRFYMVKEMAAT